MLKQPSTNKKLIDRSTRIIAELAHISYEQACEEFFRSAGKEDVFAILEDVLPPIFAKYGKYSVASKAPFRRIKYLDALATYGSDKPDLRIDLTCKDISDLFTDCEMEALRQKTVKAIDITNCTLTRKQIEKVLTDCEVQAGAKGYWFKTDADGHLAGGIAKFLAGKEGELAKHISLAPNTLVVVSAGDHRKRLLQRTDR